MNRLLFLLLGSFSSLMLYGIDQTDDTQSNLDKLPLEVFGMITQYLTHEKDIAEALKNVYRLARVNKALYKQVHNDTTTDTVVRSASKKFKKDPLEIAALIKNKQGRNWLKNYAHEHGDYELFKVVQSILAICNEIKGSINYQGAHVRNKQNSRPGVDPWFFVTKQGLMLRSDFFPSALLCTPWGGVKLFSGRSRSTVGFLAEQQEFSKRVTTHFEKVFELEDSRVKHYELVTPIDLKNPPKKFHDVCRDISAQELEDKKGESSIIISSSRAVGSLYKIIAVGDITLPDCELSAGPLSYGTRERREALEALWRVMQNEFYTRDEPS